MQGECLNELHCDGSGVAGDRAFGVLDVESGTILSAKREGRLLAASAFVQSGVLGVRLPDGTEFREGSLLDGALTEWLQRPVRVVPAATHGVGTYQSPEDFERDESTLVSWEGLAGSFVDESALHLVTTGDLARLGEERPDLQWDVRRFRPNIVIDSEDTVDMAPGRRFAFGEVEIEIEKACSRCVMTTRAQPGNLERQLDVMRHIASWHHGDVGVRARIVRAGTLRVGDAIAVLA
jgi:MOSC domain-containing protein